MELHHAGVIAVGVVEQYRAIAPQALAPIEPIDAHDSTTNDSLSSERGPEVTITLPDESYPLPDAETVATMQLLARIPPQE